MSQIAKGMLGGTLIVLGYVLLWAWADASPPRALRIIVDAGTDAPAHGAPEENEAVYTVRTLETISGATVDALPGYLAEAAESWMNFASFDETREQESAEQVHRRILSIAQDVGDVVEAEEPIFKDDAQRSLSGLLLMSVAFWEARFRGYVDDGRCNDLAWRASSDGKRLLRLGDCDGGIAHSLWQLHAFASTGDRVDAIHEAADRLRKGVRSGYGLRWYTGEGLRPSAPKAEQRMRTALDYAKAHPFAR